VAIYLGIDGGGTKTVCVVGDETRVLARATNRGSNVVRSGELAARESLLSAIREACASAQVKASDVRRVCVGGSGAARPEVAEFVRRVVGEVVSCEVMVVGDTETTLYAAFEDGPGVIAIAGTGSIAYGRNTRGETLRAGGWGFAISDEGSGQWIGRTAVTQTLRARDEGKSSGLLEEIFQAWKVEGVEELVRVANGTPPPNFSDLFPVVLRLGEAHDEVALRVLKAAGVELAEMVRIVIARLFSEEESVVVAMSGGVFRESFMVRDVFGTRIRQLRPQVVIQDDMVEPVVGALALARLASRKPNQNL
jgi:N-acetylglucosamine kinase-like BadF-type ATPase